MIKKLTTIFCLIVVPLFFIKMPTPVLSEEVRYPIPSYEGKELEKVRQWEKTWVGKKIDSNNVDEVKELLPEGLYNVMKNKERWGDSWFEIVPYRPYPVPTGRIEMTKKYSPACKIGPKEELLNWVAGVPFPEPKSGIEAAWNFDAWSRGDGQIKDSTAYIIDGRRKYDRKIVQLPITLHYAGRCDVPPVPELLPNPKGIYRATTFVFSAPPEIKGMRGLTMRYKDALKPYDTWIWITAIRRIRRVSTAQRTDTTAGGDVCYDDNYGWDGAITRNKYKLLGRKEVLLARHQDIEKIKHTEGDCIYDGYQRERINTYALEVACQDPGYIYKYSIWYLDPELWFITYSEKYDKYGKLWKSMDHCDNVVKGYEGREDAEFVGLMTIDHQRLHSTAGLILELQMGIELKTSSFTISAIQKYGR